LPLRPLRALREETATANFKFEIAEIAEIAETAESNNSNGQKAEGLKLKVQIKRNGNSSIRRFRR
jgi:hypothetical protein